MAKSEDEVRTLRDREVAHTLVWPPGREGKREERPLRGSAERAKHDPRLRGEADRRETSRAGEAQRLLVPEQVEARSPRGAFARSAASTKRACLLEPEQSEATRARAREQSETRVRTKLQVKRGAQKCSKRTLVT